MSTVTQEIQRLQTSKAAIKAAIEAKGVTVGNGTIDTYADKVALIDEWVAPADWIQLEEPNDNEILLLASDINPYYAFEVNVTGGYTVNWGDGTVDNWASGVAASHTYTVGTGQACSRGYTTFKIRIYAQTPANQITGFNVWTKTGVGINSVLWVKFGTMQINFNGNFYKRSLPSVICPYVESIEYPLSMTRSNIGMGDVCAYAYSLQNIRLPQTHTATNVTSFDQSFNSTKLKKIDLSFISKAGYFFSAFYGCYFLQELKLPQAFENGSIQSGSFEGVFINELIMPDFIGTAISSGFFANFKGKKIALNSTWSDKISSLNSFFYSNYNLIDLTFVSSVKLTSGNADSFLRECVLLKSFRFPDNTGVQITSLSYSFYSDKSLKEISNFPALNSVSLLTNTFSNCYALKSIDNLDQLGDTTTGMDLATTYAGCYSLNPAGGLRVRNKITGRFVLAGVDINNKAALTALLFTNPAAVSTWGGSSPQIDVSYCSMEAAALNALFTSIIATSASFSGKTIRITGNPGAATCDTTIITNAGGTVNKTT